MGQTRAGADPPAGGGPVDLGPVRPAGDAPPDPAARPPAAGALIELGIIGDQPVEPIPGRRPVRRGASAPLLLVLAVLLGVTGSATASPPLRMLFRLTVDAGDTFTVAGDALLVVRPDGGLSAYAVDTGRLRWRAPVTPAASYAVLATGGLLLVGEYDRTGNASTVAVSATDGRVLWRHPRRVVAVDGAPALLSVSDVHSLFVRGGAGTGRRIEGPVARLDPATGRPLWSVPVVSTAVFEPVPGVPPRMMLVHDSGRIELRDLDDGRELATGWLPAADYAPGNPDTAGGVILLRHPTAGGVAVTAYDRDLLDRRWSRAEKMAVTARVRTCGALACLAGRSGVRAVDPYTGAERWFRDTWQSVEQRGEHLLAYGAGGVELVALADAATGEVLLPLRHWRAVPTAGTDLVLRHTDASAEQIMIALVEPAGRSLRMLGELPPGTRDCRGGRYRLVCRSADGDLVGWSYRPRAA